MLDWELARVGVLVSALPDESATIKVVVPTAVWSLEAHLLASLIEQVDGLRKQMVALWADPKKVRRKNLKPLHIQRPGMPTKYERKGMTVGQLQSMIGEEE
jgi:hypothetical protein